MTIPSRAPFRNLLARAALAAALLLGGASCAAHKDPLIEPLLTLNELQYDAGVLMTKAEDLYGKDDYEQAAVEYERFLELHPVHRWAPHAQFKLALSYAHRMPEVGRDPALAEKAKAAFERVLSYSGSRYDEAARVKLVEVRRHLAETDLSVGRFYLKRKQYPAAVVRFRRVLDANLADRTTEEAAYLLAVAYERDGQIDQAAEAVRSLLTTFPQSRYAKPAEKLRARIAGGTG